MNAGQERWFAERTAELAREALLEARPTDWIDDAMRGDASNRAIDAMKSIVIAALAAHNAGLFGSTPNSKDRRTDLANAVEALADQYAHECRSERTYTDQAWAEWNDMTEEA